MESGGPVEARRKERGKEQKHRRQEEQGKKVRFGEEERFLEERRAESTDEPEGDR